MFLWLTDQETHPWGRMVLPLSVDVNCSSVMFPRISARVPTVALSRSCVKAAVLLRFRGPSFPVTAGRMWKAHSHNGLLSPLGLINLPGPSSMMFL